jgi:hypothetical protein
VYEGKHRLNGVLICCLSIKRKGTPLFPVLSPPGVCSLQMMLPLLVGFHQPLRSRRMPERSSLIMIPEVYS